MTAISRDSAERKSRPRPRLLVEADLSQVKTLFTDVDGTLTTDDRLESRTLRALEELRASGIGTVLVSGRPAGWGECWIRQLPVDAVIVENGGLYFTRSTDGRIAKVYAQPESERRRSRKRLIADVESVLREVPGARLSSDSAYTEVDLAIDYNEDVSLGWEAAVRLEAGLHARGVRAVRSSVHVNCWIGSFDKLTTVRLWLERERGLVLQEGDPRFVYCGDSFNDAPMFARFSLSVGVANVARVLDELSDPPAFITRAAEGAGVRELARALLAARRRSP